MLRLTFLSLLMCAVAPLSFVTAQELTEVNAYAGKKIKLSSVFTNDFLGDGKDRWRTGSFEVSATFGAGNQFELPDTAWSRYQFRIRSEIIAPEDLQNVNPNDRQYAGVVGLGLFTHFTKKDYDIYYGGELVFVGESTGIGDFQSNIHQDLSLTPPSDAVLNNQIPNKIYPTFHAGISKSYRSEKRLIRPFAEIQAGVETFARVGVDAIFGNAMINDFLLRDSVSGQLINHAKGNYDRGFGFLVGADAAYVVDSNYLPNSGPTSFEKIRPRVRAGMIYQTRNFDLFYGATWLGKEFDGQAEDQIVGSINLRIGF